MLEGDTEIFTTKFFSGGAFSTVGAGPQTAQFEGRDYCVWGRACQLTNVGVWVGWVEHFADSSGGTPSSSDGHLRDRALTLLTSDCRIRSVATALTT